MKQYLPFKLLILPFFLLIFQSAKVQAQDSPEEKVFENQIGISLGFNQGFVKDLNFSPLNYRESALLYSLDYIRKKPNGKGIITVDIDLSLGKLKTQASDYFISDNTVVNLEVSYLRNVSLKNQKWKLYLGGQYNSFLQILDWNDYESFSFLATHGVGVKGLAYYDLNDKHRIQTSLFVPLFQDLVRPPYNGLDEKVIENQDNTLIVLVSGKPASFKKYFAFDWKLKYTFELTQKLDVNVSYLLRYQNVNEINKFLQLQNQITTGLSLKF